MVLAPALAAAGAGELLPNGQQVFLGPNGTILALGLVYTYVPGTTTPKVTWQDPALTVPNTNPIVLDVNGQARIWGAGQYRQVVDDASGSLVWDVVTQAPGSVTGPTVTVVGHLATWADTTGTTLGGDPQIAVNVNDLDLAPGGLELLNSSNPLYFPSYNQAAAVRLKQSLSGTVSDSQGSFRDAFYIELKDSDTGLYTNSHVDYGLRVAVLGPNQGNNAWITGDKNYVALNVYAQGATSSVGQPVFPPGVSGINADAFQFGGGIGSNEFAAHQPVNGTLAQASSLVGVQAIVDSNSADVDATHTAYAVLASNIGSRAITAVYGYSGAGGSEFNRYFIQSNGAPVTRAAISMPHSFSGLEGSIIDYGEWNGAGVLSSYTWWDKDTLNGQYGWKDSGTILALLDEAGLSVGPGSVVPNSAIQPFLYLTSTAAAPSGVPRKAAAGLTACEYNTGTHTLNCYDQPGTSWYHIGLSVGPG